MNFFKWFLLILYFLILSYIVFFARRRAGLIWHSDLVNLVPLRETIHSYFALEGLGWLNFLSNLGGNILLFLPLPYFIINLFKVSNKLIITCSGVLISILIEFLQFYCQIGIPDIDDVLLNSVGVIAGCFIWEVVMGYINKVKETQ